MNSRDDDDVTMRVLVVYEDSYRSYGQTMVGAIRGLRPCVEAELIQVRELEAEVKRFDPHLVICNRPNTVDPGARVAWVRLSDDPDEPSEFCLAGRRWGSENPELEDVLKIIDEMEELLREGRDFRGC
jgi:hypothetical protein